MAKQDFFGVDETTVYSIFPAYGQTVISKIYRNYFSRSRYQMSTQFKQNVVSGTATWVTVPVSRAVLPYETDDGKTFVNWFDFTNMTEEEREKHWSANPSSTRTLVVSGNITLEPPSEFATLTSAQAWFQNNLGTAANPKVTPYLFYALILDDNTRTNLAAFNDIKHIVLQYLG